MKLLYCPACGDCVTLFKEESECQCGRCSGRYLGITKAVVSGPGVQVIAFDNHEFNPVKNKALRATSGKLRDDYHLPANEFTAWFYGPNALAVTKASTQTPRDRLEVAANTTLTYGDDVLRLVEYLRFMEPSYRRMFLEDVEAEVKRLELLNVPDDRSFVKRKPAAGK